MFMMRAARAMEGRDPSRAWSELRHTITVRRISRAGTWKLQATGLYPGRGAIRHPVGPCSCEA